MFMYWSGESIVRLSDQSDSKFSGFDPLIGNGIKVRFHATRVKREEETVLASILVARLMTVVLAGLRHVANGFRQAIESLSAPMIWVERREQQPFNPCLYCCHLARVRMIQGLVLTPMRARVALDKNVFWCLSSVFKRPHHVRGVVVGFLRRMLRDCPGLAPG